jgi:DNA invertase Pin-like site-specific DNA recombinase
MTDKPLRVGVWSAVSSKAQAAEDKVSLATQAQLAHKLAETIGGEVVASYTVPGHTRSLVFWSEAERTMPAYRQLREDVEAHRFDLLWCLDVDRLGRDPALIQQVISLVERNGAEVYISTMPHVIGQKTIGHRYGVSVQTVRAAEDQHLRTHRHRMGMAGRTKRGFFPCRPPMGYAPVRDEVTGKVLHYEFDHMSDAVRYMTELFLQGHAYNEIRRRLDRSPYRPPIAEKWNLPTVMQVLKRDEYAGLVSWGTVVAAEPSPHFPALWTPEVFAKIIRERRRRSRSPYVRLGSGPLTGVAFCNRCGSPMGRYKANIIRLRCSRHMMSYVEQAPKCHHNGISEMKVILAVADSLSLLDSEEMIDQVISMREMTDEENRLREDLERARRHEQDLAKQRERLALAYATGKMDVEIYHTTDLTLHQQLDAEAGRCAELARHIENLPDMNERRESLRRLAANFPIIARESDPAEVSVALQSGNVRALVESSQVVNVHIG